MQPSSRKAFLSPSQISTRSSSIQSARQTAVARSIISSSDLVLLSLIHYLETMVRLGGEGFEWNVPTPLEPLFGTHIPRIKNRTSRTDLTD